MQEYRHKKLKGCKNIQAFPFNYSKTNKTRFWSINCDTSFLLVANICSPREQRYLAVFWLLKRLLLSGRGNKSPLIHSRFWSVELFHFLTKVRQKSSSLEWCIIGRRVNNAKYFHLLHRNRSFVFPWLIMNVSPSYGSCAHELKSQSG